MAKPEIRIRKAIREDGKRIAGIARISPEAAQWTEQQFVGAADGSLDCFVADRNGLVVGFGAARIVADEAEILNIAVAPDARRQHVAAALLEKILRKAKQRGAKSLFLEVRGSNVGAIGLYRKAGFSQSALRRSYYSDPVEDALIFTKVLEIEE